MKLIELYESKREMPTEQILDKIKTECSDAFQAFLRGTHLYRGDSETSEGMSVLLTPTGYHPARWAASNIHYDLMEIIPEWQSVPSRTKSIDLTTAESKASGYGQDYYFAFPRDGAELAFIEGASDFWFGFGERRRDHVGEWVSNIKNIVLAKPIKKLKLLKDDDDSYTDDERRLISLWDRYDSRDLQRIRRDGPIAPFPEFRELVDLIHKVLDVDLIQKINDYMDPSIVQTITTGEFGVLDQHPNVEVWTESSVYLLDYETGINLLNEVAQ